jgi:hypothetical protein
MVCILILKNLLAENIPLNIVYESDALLMIIKKPGGCRWTLREPFCASYFDELTNEQQ